MNNEPDRFDEPETIFSAFFCLLKLVYIWKILCTFVIWKRDHFMTIYIFFEFWSVIFCCLTFYSSSDILWNFTHWIAARLMHCWSNLIMDSYLNRVLGFELLLFKNHYNSKWNQHEWFNSNFWFGQIDLSTNWLWFFSMIVALFTSKFL